MSLYNMIETAMMASSGGSTEILSCLNHKGAEQWQDMGGVLRNGKNVFRKPLRFHISLRSTNSRSLTSSILVPNLHLAVV